MLAPAFVLADTPHSCPSCGVFLAENVPPETLCAACAQVDGAPEGPTLITPPAPAVATLIPGAANVRVMGTIGDYQVLEKLGQGGMGAVYRARQISLDRFVALKVLPAQFGDDPDYIARFQREAKVAAKLHHENLVGVYGYGQADGCHYIAMELIEGENLHDRLRREPTDMAEALGITYYVAQALQCGWNSEQLVHRDVKPSNIYLSRNGEVKVGDLGLAKTLGSNTTGITQTGTMMGTPHYMSPEQCRGDRMIDFRADIYSMGCMLFEMLTGHPPYPGSDPVAIVRKHLDTPPPGLLKELPVCPVPLALLVGRMLKKAPRERHASYEELIAEIEALYEHLERGEELDPTQFRRPVQRAVPATSVSEGTPEWVWWSVIALIGIALGLVFWPRGKTRPLVVAATHAAPMATPRASPIAAATPKPAPSAPAPAVTIAAPSFGPWQPLFTDAEWNASEPGKREVVDRRVHLVRTNVLKPQPAADGAIRARIQWQEESKFVGVVARRTTGFSCYQAQVFDSGKAVNLRYFPLGQGGDKAIEIEKRDLPKALQPGDTVLLELRLQGDRLTVLVDGALAIEAQDSRLPGPGQWGVAANDGWFESVEVQTPLPASPAIVATKDAPFVNTLGMKFVPVPIVGGPTAGKTVLFSVWETRVQDYAAFATETKRELSTPGYEQGPTHPAVMVSWDDATAFCAWLTERESRSRGTGSSGWVYRLPSDHEWSCAVGLGEREDAAKLPSEKNEAIADEFPWGTTWPPPAGAGNYAGEELQPLRAAGRFPYLKGVLTGYRDDAATTAPVGSFAANRFGLFDLGGNAWEWCEDWYQKEQTSRVQRGVSFYYHDRGDLLSSHRGRSTPASRIHDCGFRCVITLSESAPAVAVPPAAATKDAPFVNTLGMKFVPVPIVGGPTAGKTVLFSVWETRVQDYETFVTETKREWPKPSFEQGPTHPAGNVTFEDAVAFCAWLTERERKAGNLGPSDVVRVASDHEWSCAAGIGDREDPAQTPAEKDGGNSDLFVWGTQWPPPAGTGNFSGAEAVGHEVWDKQQPLPGYRDDFPWSAPVGSFPPNALGLFDLAGNMIEWCADTPTGDAKATVRRGGSFADAEKSFLGISRRSIVSRSLRHVTGGFRCVVALSAPLTALVPPAASFGPWQPLFTEAEWKQTVPDRRDLEEGRIRLRNRTAMKPQLAADGAIRVRIRWREGARAPSVAARWKADNGKYKLSVDQTSATLFCFTGDSTSFPLGRYSFPAPLQPGGTVLVELRLQGDQLTVLVDGAVVIETRDSRVPGPGNWGILGTDGWFESVEVQTPLPAIAATKDAPFVNTLGMKFVPVPIVGGSTAGKAVLFSVWDTRVQDYSVFATETKREWPKPGFEQGPTHPAVMVNWLEAQAFCTWLTKRERTAGRLGANDRYRLPSDHEWSCAGGIGDQEDAGELPSAKGGKLKDIFVWGSAWPPPEKAGNFAGDESGRTSANGRLQGYHDDFANTSPVGGFTPTPLGLYDMAGNVHQWCEDWHEPAQTERVARGTSWGYTSRNTLRSSARFHFAPDLPSDWLGFRCVLEVATPAAAASAPAASAADGWQDLLAALTPELVAQTGHGWSLKDGELFSPDTDFATLPLPAKVAGTSYQVRVKLRQLAAKNTFYITLPVADRICGFELDGRPTGGIFTGLSLVNGKYGKNLPGVVEGKQVNDFESHDLEVTVRLDGANATIITTLDTRPLYAWTGPTAALSQVRIWATTEPGALALGTMHDDWAVAEVKLKQPAPY